MRKSGWTPSIVPNGDDQNVYLVVDDFGRNGRACRETDVERADLEAVIMDMLEGQYQNPVRVVGFNTAEKWSEDVSGDVAHELRRRSDLQLMARNKQLSWVKRKTKYFCKKVWTGQIRLKALQKIFFAHAAFAVLWRNRAIMVTAMSFDAPPFRPTRLRRRARILRGPVSHADGRLGVSRARLPREERRSR
jgi:hypothetical protein